MLNEENYIKGSFNDQRNRFCVVVSTAMTATAFLRDQLRELSLNCNLHVLANAPDSTFLNNIGVRAIFTPVPLERNISPRRDLQALLALRRAFRRIKPNIVHSVTPKAGLLAMAAAFIEGVPTRIHTFTGQVWANKRGSGRWILKNIDRLIALLATHVLVDSSSQRDFLLANRVISARKSAVLGQGSISGVDLQRFKPDPQARSVVRSKFGLGEDTLLFLYVGRLNRDKGIPELLEAFVRSSGKHMGSCLLLVGPDEEGLEHLIPVTETILRVGYTHQPESYMAAADVFVLPSHREGFGSTVIEAAACGLPAIASRIYGLTDAVIDGQTGILHTPGNVSELAAAMIRFAQDAEERRRMGEAARRRAETQFEMQTVTANTMQFYQAALANHDSTK